MENKFCKKTNNNISKKKRKNQQISAIFILDKSSATELIAVLSYELR